MNAIWTPRAIAHLVHLRRHIEKDSESNAARMASRIIEAIDILESHPEMGRPGRIAGTRELVVPGTPYVIPYRVRRERLELLAILHGRQEWPERL